MSVWLIALPRVEFRPYNTLLRAESAQLHQFNDLEIYHDFDV